MRITILSTMILSVLLAAATGCSATSSQVKSTTPVADVADDPSWTPPGQMNMAIEDGRSSQTKNDLATTLPTPNKREIRSGQIHAAYGSN